MPRSRTFRAAVVAVAGLAVATLATAPATADAEPPVPALSRPDSWVGQIVRHDRHFDYRGSYCPEDTEACIMIVANFRLLPLTPQAATGLRRAVVARAAGRIQPGLRPMQILGLFSVQTFANLVRAKQEGRTV